MADAGLILAELGSAADAAALRDRLLAERPGERFVGVVSADLGPAAGEILTALRPALAEIVCCDTPGESGAEFALRALDQFGFGQDFVFTVPRREDAIARASTGGSWRARTWSTSAASPTAEPERGGERAHADRDRR